MPISGLSEVLENMLQAVLKSHNLKTWNIFNERDGTITFRLKFSSQIQDNSIEPIENMSFRRKTPKQVDRDRHRTAKRPRQVSPDSVHSTPEIETDRNVCETTNCDMDDTIFDNSLNELNSELEDTNI